MGKLGDFLPVEIKTVLAESSIKQGTVVRCFVKNTNPPKEKIFVILGLDNAGHFIGAVFINTNVNFYIINNQELLDLQYPIKCCEHNFLKYDSFIDCSKLMKFEFQYIKEKLIENPGCMLGTLKKDTIDVIIELVKKSPNITPIDLNNIGINSGQ